MSPLRFERLETCFHVGGRPVDLRAALSAHGSDAQASSGFTTNRADMKTSGSLQTGVGGSELLDAN